MGRAPCCDKANVKKGPWSPEEDSKLKDYIHKYGTGGNWISLPQKAGLKRCGKSCRLRWLNYLRPNIKHGEFTEDEDRIICTLFANIGSRWSIIAAQLPGRTDNDIKNYWNTKLKKKLLGPTAPPLLPQISTISQYSQSLIYSSSSSLLHHQSLPTLVPQSLAYTTHTSDHLSLVEPTMHHYVKENSNNNNNVLVFGSSQDQASCSSSDNGSYYMSYSQARGDHQDQVINIKQDHHQQSHDMGFPQSFISNNGLQQRSSLGHSDVSNSHLQWTVATTTTTLLDQMEKGYVEEIPFDDDIENFKQLISSNSYGGIDENKAEGDFGDFEKRQVMDQLHQNY